MGDEMSQHRLQSAGVGGRHEEGGLGPHLAEGRDIAEHERAAGKRCFQGREPERLVSGRKRIDGGPRHPVGELDLRQASESARAASPDGLARGVMSIAGHVNRPGQLVGHLFQQCQVLGFIPQAAGGED